MCRQLSRPLQIGPPGDRFEHGEHGRSPASQFGSRTRKLFVSCMVLSRGHDRQTTRRKTPRLGLRRGPQSPLFGAKSRGYDVVARLGSSLCCYSVRRPSSVLLSRRLWPVGAVPTIMRLRNWAAEREAPCEYARGCPRKVIPPHGGVKGRSTAATLHVHGRV